ncbi:cell division protein ZipA [Shewanella intestini]|uniref:Cell division protein ZipA n=1 Tax=Shewanella intestini TaxID=2017544 RepID=A0ABS5HYW5_9GAMM|nr:MULTISPECIES: cell division protein ZipA [Shewanella]MBR9726969.1 cell division protein ZipA [Shewanella intestini]MRG34465.1 cell division protein ZipA [Shewanella sp. XMDDZSB0408]
MKDLQLVLFVVGAIAIIAVLIHGFWSIRRQQPKSMKESPMVDFYKNQSKRRDAEGFDADGIGEVRVRKTATQGVESNNEPASQPLTEPTHNEQTTHELAGREQIEPTLTASAESVEQTFTADTSDSQLFNDNKIDDLANQSSTDDTSYHATLDPVVIDTTSVNHSDNESQAAFVANEADNLSKTQDNAYVDTASEDSSATASQTTSKDSAVEQEPKDVLVLHVVAKDGQQLQGAELLPSLLALNFKFGEMEIFHRHIDNAGTGDTLFSLANMMKPGTFDPDNMEQFVTQGVVLFMTLPCYGNPEMNFTIMLNSALALAEDLDAQLLDGTRDLWTDSTRSQYQQRIKQAMAV